MSDDQKPKKRKAGRRPKPGPEKERARTTVRATDREWKVIRGRAAESGLSLSRYLVAVGMKDRAPLTEQERDDATKLLFELHRAGVNLNQIAARLHMLSGTISVKEVNEAVAEVRQAGAAVRERMKA